MNREPWEYPKVEFVHVLPPFDAACSASANVFTQTLAWVTDELFGEPGLYEDLAEFEQLLMTRALVEVGVSPWASGPHNCERITLDFQDDRQLVVLVCEWDDALLVLLPPTTEGQQ